MHRIITGCIALTIASSAGIAGSAPSPSPLEVPVYYLPPPDAPHARIGIELTGPWQVAPYAATETDEAPYEPLSTLPDSEWQETHVPSSIWEQTDIASTHRCAYRAKVFVPRECKGRSFILRFEATNWIASVFVDGIMAGTHTGVFTRWSLDVTAHMHPGREHMIAVAIKSPWYSLDTPAMGQGSRTMRDIPNDIDRLRAASWVAPLWTDVATGANGNEYGITGPVELICAGKVYVEDVFVRTDFTEHALEADVTVRNPTDKHTTIAVQCSAISDRADRAKRQIGEAILHIPSGESRTTTVTSEWPDAKLWWPEQNAHTYTLETVLQRRRELIDVESTSFGFREVTIREDHISINGTRRNLWCWDRGALADGSPREFLSAYRRGGDRLVRFSPGSDSRMRGSLSERLRFCDENGIPVVLVALMDGSSGSYDLDNPLVWTNFMEQASQMTRVYRNHPCVIAYQFGHSLDNATDEPAPDANPRLTCADVLLTSRISDPTRLHYTVGLARSPMSYGPLVLFAPESKPDGYPDEAYTLGTLLPVEGRMRPIVIAGSACPAHASFIGGESVFVGPSHLAAAEAKWFRMLCEGYRWRGVSAFLPGSSAAQHDDGWRAFSDIAIVPRQRRARLTSESECEMQLKVLNDTLIREPITFRWSYWTDDLLIASGEEDLDIEPGCGIERTLSITAPRAAERREGELFLSASQGDARYYADTLAVPVLPRIESIDLNAPLLLLDASKQVESFLSSCGVPYERLEDLASAEDKGGLLLIGPDTLSPKDAYGTGLMRFAVRGGIAIVLEQSIPAQGSALPYPARSTTRHGGYAFGQAPGSRVFRDLEERDLVDWSGSPHTYINAYEKPVAGAVSLVECGDGLRDSAMLEIPCGRGVIVCSQLAIGAALDTDPAARVLLRNMIEYYACYEPRAATVSVCDADEEGLADAVRRAGVEYVPISSPTRAIDKFRYGIAVIDATAANLAELVSVKDDVESYLEFGGWIMLCGLEPSGLKSFDSLVDQKLPMARFERDNALITNLVNTAKTLATGLSNGDLAGCEIGDDDGRGPVHEWVLADTDAASAGTSVLSAYPHEKGGILLNQIRFDGTTDDGRMRVLSTLLQNMGARLSNAALATPGVNVRFDPVDIAPFCNAVRSSSPHATGTLQNDTEPLPETDKHLIVCADVEYYVPRQGGENDLDCIALHPNAADGRGSDPATDSVEGIDVGRLADALFFLHAAVASPGGRQESTEPRRGEHANVMQYTITYEDGKTVSVPIREGDRLAWSAQTSPLPLPRAAVAWSTKMPEDERSAVYSTKWINPYPKLTIRSIGIHVPPASPCEAAFVLAITAGTVLK